MTDSELEHVGLEPASVGDACIAGGYFTPLCDDAHPCAILYI